MAENHRALLREWNLPRWSAGYWGERTAGGLAALPADMAAHAAMAAARGSMLYDAHPRPPSVPDETPTGAMAALGADSGMPLGTTPDAVALLTTALRARWTQHGGGPRAWLQAELARMGYAPLPIEVESQRTHTEALRISNGTLVSAGPGATMTVGWGAHTAGDLGLLAIASGGTSVPGVLSGWTMLGLDAVGTDAAGVSLALYRRTATSGAEASVIVPPHAGSRQIGVISVYRGATVSGFAIDASADANSSAAVPAPAVSVAGRGRTALYYWAPHQSSATVSLLTGPGASGASLQFAQGFSSGPGRRLDHWAGVAAATSTGPIAATLASASRSAAATIVLTGTIESGFWARFWVDFPEGSHQALGVAAVVGSMVVGADSIGPFTQPEWALWFRNLVATVERCRPAEWVCWDYEFTVPDGTIRIQGHPRFADPDYVYFTAA